MRAKSYLNTKTGEIAEYDTVMGLFYVKGKENKPYAEWELEKSTEWKLHRDRHEMHNSTIVNCECHSHKLEHQYDKGDSTHYISFWTHGVNGENPGFKKRFKEAWRILSGKKLKGFWGVVLSDENAQLIAESIQKKKHSI